MNENEVHIEVKDHETISMDENVGVGMVSLNVVRSTLRQEVQVPMLYKATKPRGFVKIALTFTPNGAVPNQGVAAPLPGYGLPSQQPGYGYPPPQQPGYGYPPPPQQVIIEQPGYGYPPPQQQVIIEQGGFRPREEIIIERGGFGRREEVIIRQPGFF